MAHGAAARAPGLMKLLIAIPAFNEEASIHRTIERGLHARQKIIDGAPVTHVEITVVSDGFCRVLAAIIAATEVNEYVLDLVGAQLAQNTRTMD